MFRHRNALLLAIVLMPATAQAATHPVSLADAHEPPTAQRTIKPGQTFTLTTQCADNATDTSAYTASGGPLGAQQWNADRTVTFWQRGKHRVTFDGITFRNHTSAPVIAAAWC